MDEHTAGPAPALRRGLAVLTVLARRAGPVSAAALARELGLPRSSTYELLGELAAAGFAVHLPESRQWGLGVAAFELGSAYLRADPLERLGRPLLARLAERTRATAHLGVLHGAEILYLVKERPPDADAAPPTLITAVGVRLPATLSATGLSLLAGSPPAQVRALFGQPADFLHRTGRGPRSLPELRRSLSTIRARGWAVEDGCISVDTASVAAPVFDHLGRPCAAVGVTVPHRCPSRPDGPACGTDLAHLAGPVREVTAALTAAIGGRAPA
ncbi:IclR family transcriptional regulator [Nakamurella flavida]|uniref:IclR family transcriptional regulator n=1 Tax=Nakamurella flavida TaxID=363630 RepID=A0A938YPV1_9ACTN|nr:IclR family transcriptional regulator [Nakamurella flavida]MBM9477023.1 IclR family transcriptional regulator [Nakamurella flavida]MDP9779968.1 DNA-binding IclR family transcriptional regulator [Nakamurella flavida]